MLSRKTTRSLLRPFVSTAAGALLVGAPALATWSVVAVDRATGEVCVAGATCIAGLPLKGRIGVVVVGTGAAAGQAFSSPIVNRQMGNLLAAGLSPQEVLDALGTPQDLAARQFGIVNFDDPAVTFSGAWNGLARPGVTGEIGTIRYAIQGNVLAGDAVVFEAEQTFRQSTGDLGQRVMEAMHTARLYGGDGRCSCSVGQPTSCGSPPPNFTYSAYTAFIVVARIGDRDSVDNWHSGSYYLDRRYIGDANDIDPIIGLQGRYDDWRANRIGIVDGILSEVEPSATRMPADGTTTIEVTVRMRDIDGNPLAFGGFPLYVRGIGGPQAASVESVVDNGDGTFTVTLRAGTNPGHCRWRLVADQGVPRTLHPPLELDVDPLAPLHLGRGEVSAASAPEVPLVLNAGVADAGRNYLVLASASGTQPGTPFGGQTLPLNDDRLLRFTLAHPGPPTLPGSSGQLDALGRAEAALRPRPEMLLPFVGGRWDFAAVLFGSPNDFTDPVGFGIVP